MKNFSVLVAACLFGVALVSSAAEPPKDLEHDQQAVVALTKEIQSQQATIADNQSKIDAKTAAIAEALRLARIYASRAGR